MKEPQECPNCLYPPAAPKKQEAAADDCNQCFYEQPAEKQPDECAQCFYEPVEEDKKADDCNQCFYTPKKD